MSTSTTVFLDESGDLGWAFCAPYRKGGSSRFLTIAAVILPEDVVYAIHRLLREMYQERGWVQAKEKKWSDMSDGAKLGFAQKAKKLVERHPEIQYLAITLDKQSVLDHLRLEPSLLYNHLLRLLLADHIRNKHHVLLVPDQRSIKVASGNSQHDHLQHYLWYVLRETTRLQTKPTDSHKELGIQFADMLAGVVQSHFEDGKSKPWHELSPLIAHLQFVFYEAPRSL
jgi:Protein of unknown function (DUF3800)